LPTPTPPMRIGRASGRYGAPAGCRARPGGNVVNAPASGLICSDRGLASIPRRDDRYISGRRRRRYPSEEPLAHVFTGYEKSFAELWLTRYGQVGSRSTLGKGAISHGSVKTSSISSSRRLLKATLQFEKAAAGMSPSFCRSIRSTATSPHSLSRLWGHRQPLRHRRLYRPDLDGAGQLGRWLL